MSKKSRSRRQFVLVCANLRIDLTSCKVFVRERLNLRHFVWEKSHLQLAPGFTLNLNAAGLPLLIAPTGHEIDLPDTARLISQIYHMGPYLDEPREHQVVY